MPERIGLALWTLMAMAVSLPTTAVEINKGAHLNTSGQSKVNALMAKQYLEHGVEQVQQNQNITNVGSEKAGTCKIDIGATPSGGKGSKETIVVAKTVVQVCK